MTPSNSPLRALLLDFDGTVADTLGLIHRCLDETAQELLGVEFPHAIWEEHIGHPLATLFALLGNEAIARSDELIDSYRRRQASSADTICAFPGVAETLASLRTRNVRLAIVTTKVQRIARQHLNATGLAELFDCIIGFDDCEQPKPHPEPFLRALAILGVEPHEAAAIGDTRLDIEGARAAGVFAIGALWCGAGHSEMLAAEPDLVIQHPSELLQLNWPAED